MIAPLKDVDIFLKINEIHTLYLTCIYIYALQFVLIQYAEYYDMFALLHRT